MVGVRVTLRIVRVVWCGPWEPHAAPPQVRTGVRMGGVCQEGEAPYNRPGHVSVAVTKTEVAFGLGAMTIRLGVMSRWNMLCWCTASRRSPGVAAPGDGESGRLRQHRWWFQWVDHGRGPPTPQGAGCRCLLVRFGPTGRCPCVLRGRACPRSYVLSGSDHILRRGLRMRFCLVRRPRSSAPRAVYSRRAGQVLPLPPWTTWPWLLTVRLPAKRRPPQVWQCSMSAERTSVTLNDVSQQRAQIHSSLRRWIVVSA